MEIQQKSYSGKGSIMEQRSITPDMAGCWLDGAAGWHNTYRVVDLAVEFGMELSTDDSEALNTFRKSGPWSDEDTRDYVYDLSDTAVDYLDGLMPEGFYFVWDDGAHMVPADEIWMWSEIGMES